MIIVDILYSVFAGYGIYSFGCLVGRRISNFIEKRKVNKNDC